MVNFQCAPTVRNCVFRANKARKDGAMYNMTARTFPPRPRDSDSAVPLIIHCAFIENFAQARGGAVSNDLGTSPEFRLCRFINNRTEEKGGAIYNDFGCSPVIVSCLFVRNIAFTAGAIGNDGGSSPVVACSTFTRNKAEDEGAALYQGTGPANNPLIIKCILWGNICENGPAEIANWHDCEPRVTDLIAHGRHPDYWRYEAGLTALLVNLVRTALGAEPAVAPGGREYDEARLAFYGYGYARQFVLELQSLKGAANTVDDRLAAADRNVAAAAERLLAGDADGMRRLLREAGGQLLAARNALTSVQPYFVRGWHGGLLSDRMVGGEIVGCAEWGWPSFSMRWAEARLHAAEHLNTKEVNQICGNTWDVIADYGITDLERWKNASSAGLVETVKGMYSDTYLEVLGTESNLRQFEFGLKALARMGAKVRTYANAYDDFAFHPQLPQILRGFGFEFAILRHGHPGMIAGVDKEVLIWKGLNGALIPAVPKYKTDPISNMGNNLPGGSNRGGVNTMARALVAAEKAGFRTVLAGGIQDHTMTMHGEYEWEAFNAMVPVQATPTTFADYFAAVKPDPEPRYCSTDELLGMPYAWSGFGSLNQMAREDRHVERLLVTAEKFSALAAAVGRPYPEKKFAKAWKNLLSSQDHFTYGCGGVTNPEGYHVGGLQEPFIPDYPGPRTPITTENISHDWKTSAEDIAREALNGALVDLVRREARPGPGDARQVVVYNACNWDRAGEVQCWIPAPKDQELSVWLVLLRLGLAVRWSLGRQGGPHSPEALYFLCSLHPEKSIGTIIEEFEIETLDAYPDCARSVRLEYLPKTD